MIMFYAKLMIFIIYVGLIIYSLYNGYQDKLEYQRLFGKKINILDMTAFFIQTEIEDIWIFIKERIHLIIIKLQKRRKS